MSQYPRIVAGEIRSGILQRLPKTEEVKPYRMALDVARVAGLSPGDSAYAVWVNPRHRKVKTVDVGRVVLYVCPRTVLGKVNAEAAVLEKYNPWTYDSLPFWPPQAKALVKTKRASKNRITRVRRMRRKDRPRWRRELARLGVRLNEDKSTKKPKIDPKNFSKREVPQIIFDALRMEFGLERKAQPHWRPALLRFLSVGVRSLSRRHPGLTLVLTRLGFRSWRKWPTRTRSTIRIQIARGFDTFQKKLGIRAGR
jgi:hypothetical protein